MMVCLQRYDLCITYKRGLEMYLADALSRAYPDHSAPHHCHNFVTVEVLDLMEHFPTSAKRLTQR